MLNEKPLRRTPAALALAAAFPMAALEQATDAVEGV